MGARASVAPRPKVEGLCDPKYEKVKKQLEYMLTKGADENVQLCVYVGSRPRASSNGGQHQIS